MSKLKKLIALTLALAMILSVSAFAGSDYADADKIDEACVESVELLYGLDIMKGDGKNFNPTATITRAEMAKMIYVVLNYGKDDLAVNYKGAKMFSDVPAGAWYEGYVNYCAATNLVQGDGAGKFNPMGTLTTAAAAKMLLTAIGYDAEARGYVGAGWEKNVLSDASILKLLDGYNYPTNTAAPRQWVAVMFKNALLNAYTYDTITPVIYNGLLTGNTLPEGKYKTMGEKYFKLVEFEGVITANEYADLYDTEGLSSGKTEIDGVKYNLSTTLKDLGESRHGYAIGSKVLYIEDAGNTTWENEGAAVSISSASKFKNASGLSRGGESFVNFGGEEGVYKCDYRIEYKIEANTNKVNLVDFIKDYDLSLEKTDFKAGANGIYTYEKAIKANADITADDYNNIKAIFVAADNDDDQTFVGDVYVGTKSNEDISDEMSWKKFVGQYLTDATNNQPVSGADNGEWLKIIDNDQDGVADYVFLTTFTMTTIEEHNTKKDYYTFEDGKQPEEWEIATEDELAVDDVILYTVIDGVYYVDVVTPVSVTIDKKGIDYKNETITCDGTEYAWSGIEHDADDYYYDISDAETEENYDLYLDHFGYVRLYVKSGYNRGFVLLTDGWYETNKRDETFMAQIYDLDEEKLTDVEIIDSTSYPADVFIETDTSHGDKDWGRLIEAGQTYFWTYPDDVELLTLVNDHEPERVHKYTKETDPFITNIAAYSTSEDGYNLDLIERASNKTTHWIVELDLEDADADDKTFANFTYPEWDVQATTKTQYYFVQKDKYGAIDEVYTWVGYNNAPDAAELAKGAVGYAVTVDGEGSYYYDDNRYDVAQVIVFESDESVSSAKTFVYALDQKWQAAKAYDAWTLSATEDGYAYEIAKEVKNGEIMAEDLINFFSIYSNGQAEIIDKDYADYYIYAGEVRVAKDVYNNDYVKITRAGMSGYTYFDPTTTPAYVVYEDTDQTSFRKQYEVEDLEEAYDVFDKLIVVTNKDGKVEYVINVSESYTDDDDSWGQVQALNELYAAIYADAQPDVLNTTVELAVKFGTEKVVAGTTENLTYAQAKGVEAWTIEALNDTEILYVDGEKVTVGVNGCELKLTVVARSEDGKATESKTYTVQIAAADDRTGIICPVSYIQYIPNGDDYTVEVLDTSLDLDGLTLRGLAEKCGANYSGSVESITPDADAGTVTVTVASESGEFTQNFTFKSVSAFSSLS